MPRVTLVVNNADEGSETFLHTLTDQLAAMGHDVTVHALLQGRTTMATGASFRSGGASASGALPPVRSPRFLPSAARLALGDPPIVAQVGRQALERFGRGGRAARAAALAAPIAVTRPDVVHVAFSGIGVALIDAIELLDPDTRLVVSCRGTGELVTPTIDASVHPTLRRVLERADLVHAVADVVARAAIDLGAGADRVRVVRPAVDVERFTRSTPIRSAGSRARVVTVSRLHWIKALDVQLAALAELRRRGRDLRWQVVGDGPERGPLEFRARALGVEDDVEFVGSCPPDQVRELVEASDVFVCSSLSEGTSNAVLEAMALQVPVVSSAAGGMPEVITDGVDGLIAPVGDPIALADALEALIDQPELASALAERGRRTVIDGYTLERQQADWAAAYAEVAAVR